jgi:hypothetical protein
MDAHRAKRPSVSLGLMMSALILVACASLNASVASPAEGESVLVIVPEDVASGVELDIVAAGDLEESAPYWTFYPEYRRVTLAGCALESNLHKAQS